MWRLGFPHDWDMPCPPPLNRSPLTNITMPQLGKTGRHADMFHWQWAKTKLSVELVLGVSGELFA